MIDWDLPIITTEGLKATKVLKNDNAVYQRLVIFEDTTEVWFTEQGDEFFYAPGKGIKLLNPPEEVDKVLDWSKPLHTKSGIRVVYHHSSDTYNDYENPYCMFVVLATETIEYYTREGYHVIGEESQEDLENYKECLC